MGICGAKRVLGANLGFWSGCTFMVTAPWVLGVSLKSPQGFINISRVIDSSSKDFWLLYEILTFGCEEKNQGFAYEKWVACFWAIILL